MIKKIICGILASTMLFAGSIVNAETVLNKPITADGISMKNMEGNSIIGWNGWDDWAGNNPVQYSRFMSATVEKDPLDQALSFADANKVFKFTLKGIYNTTGRPEGAVSCDSNMHVNRIFDLAKKGKVRINTKLYNDSTEEGKAASFHFIIGDEESQKSSSLEKRLLNLEIAGSAIYVKSNFGETGQAAATITNAVPYGKWFDLSTEIDTDAKTWAIYVDGKKVGNGVFGGAVDSVNLVAYSVDRSGNTAFKSSSNPDKMVKWYADDLEVQTYSEPSTSSMPTLLSKWQTVSGDNFEGVTAPITINNFAAQYPRIKINSGVTGAFDRYQDVSIVKQDDNNILHMEQLTKSGANSQNIRTFWRLFENGGNIDNGCVKVSMRINGENSNDKSFYIYATKEITDWSQTAQIDPNSAIGSGQALNEIRIWGGDHIAARSQAGDYTGYNTTAWNKNMGWAKLDIIYNLSLKKYTVWINDKQVEFHGISQGQCPFYEGEDWNIGSIALRIPRDQGGQTWLVDDINVSVLDGWKTVEKEDVTGNLTVEGELPDDWTLESGDACTTANPACESDATICLKAGSSIYTTFEAQKGIVEAKADIYVPKHNSTMLPFKMYTADGNGNRLTEVRIDEYSIKNGFAESKSPYRVGASQVEWEELAGVYNYHLGSWFTLKTVADMTNRTYDIYINDEKINSGALDFYSKKAPTDNGLASRIGFESLSEDMYINNIKVDVFESEYSTAINKVTYANANQEESTIPVAGGSIKSVTFNNTGLKHNAVIYACVYDNNVLKTITQTPVDKNLATGVVNVPLVETKLPETISENTAIRVFLWDAESELKPAAFDYVYGELKLPTLYITGDSINTNYDAIYYPRGGWGFELKSMLDPSKIRIVNCAAAGNSTTQYLSNGRLDYIKDRILPGDYIFVESVHNDANQHIPEADYRANLQAYVDMANEHGAHCIFVTSPELRIDLSYCTTSDFNNYTTWLKEIANANNLPIIDLNKSWGEFLVKVRSNGGEDAALAYYNHVYYDPNYASDFRWEVAQVNKDGKNYLPSAVKEDDLHPNVIGARKEAAIVAEGIKALDLPIKDSVLDVDLSYSVEGDTLTVSGNGNMPVFATFDEAPWSDEAGIKHIIIEDGIKSVTVNAFSGFEALEDVTIAESVATILTGSFPKKEFVVYGWLNSGAEKYASNDPFATFYIKELRILGIGNSHTSDYSQWKDLILNDLKDAGVKTDIIYDSVRNGGYQAYCTDYLDPWVENTPRSHYEQGTRYMSKRYDDYKDKLENYKWDLVLIQDYRESALAKSDFTTGIAKVMKWLRNKQPTAKIGWIVDWADKGSAGTFEGQDGKYNKNDEATRNAVKNIFLNNTLSTVNNVENMKNNKPDIMIMMGTVLQNARTSYLATSLNAADCYYKESDSDWAKGTIQNYSQLERDQTHCSYEVGRYLVGAGVYGKIFDMYKDVIEGGDIDFYDALKTAPVTTGENTWKGDFTDTIWSIIRESGRNMIANPKEITPSIYVEDPADELAVSVENAEYPTFTADGIVSVVKSINPDIAISAEDVVISGDNAEVTFLYGYTKKTVSISK